MAKQDATNWPAKLFRRSRLGFFRMICYSEINRPIYAMVASNLVLAGTNGYRARGPYPRCLKPRSFQLIWKFKTLRVLFFFPNAQKTGKRSQKPSSEEFMLIRFALKNSKSAQNASSKLQQTGKNAKKPKPARKPKLKKRTGLEPFWDVEDDEIRGLIY